MKRKVAMMLAITMTFLIVGCGKNEQTKGTNEIPTLLWYVPGEKQSDISAVIEEINKKTVEKIGAKIDLQFIDTGAFSERMTMNMASGGKYDLCFTGYVNVYRPAVNKGGLLELDEMIEKRPQLKAVIPDYAWSAAKVKNKIYAVPNMQIMAHQLTLYTFKDLADKYNLDISKIKKTEDIEPYLEKIKQNEKNIYPFRTHWGESSFGTDFYKEETLVDGLVAECSENGDIKVKVRPEADYYKKSVNILRKWFEKGYIRGDVASNTDDTQDFMMGKYAVWIGGYKPGILEDNKLQYGREVICAPVAKTVLESGSGLAAMTGISKNSKYPELAMDFIQYVNTDKEFFNLICYGIENKHYKKIGDNRIETIADSGYNTAQSPWKFGNNFNSYLVGEQPEDTYEQTQKMNEEAYKSPLLGFVPDITPIQNEISQCQTIINEYKVTKNGAEDPKNYYDEFLKRLHEAGIDKMLTELQGQIDQWKLEK